MHEDMNSLLAENLEIQFSVEVNPEEVDQFLSDVRRSVVDVRRRVPRNELRRTNSKKIHDFIVKAKTKKSPGADGAGNTVHINFQQRQSTWWPTSSTLY